MQECIENRTFARINSMRKYVLFFLVYAIFGWIYEVFIEIFVHRWGFADRGVLFGPYCPVYGFGALLFLFCFYPLFKGKKLHTKLLWCFPVFLACMALATLLELFTSYLLEWTIGSWPWQTYKAYDLNFQGRISFSPSVRFGIGGVFILYLFQPLFETVVSKLSDKKLAIISVCILVVLATDLIYTIFFR